jgi:O-antigen/teichoic acid export membrane protein
MVVFPAISELQGQRRTDTICDLYLTSSRIIISFAAAFTVPLLIFGIRFLTLWMGSEFAERGGIAMLLITLGVFVNQGTNVPTFVVNGLGRPEVSGLAALANAVLFLGMMIPGVIYGDITGAAAAFAASAVIVAPGFLWYVNSRVLKLTVVQLVKDVYMRPLLAGMAVAIPLLLVPQERIHNLFLLLLVMGAGMGLYFISALLFGVYQAHERKVLMDYLGGVISRWRNRRAP